MPNRILKESICTSDSVDQLEPLEETFFYRLIVRCDDYGRFDARPRILKAMLFPLKDYTYKQMEECLYKLSSVGMVKLYEKDGKPYLQLSTWEHHQQIRSKKSKYPSLEDGRTIKSFDELCESLQTNDNICKHLQTDVPVIQSNPIQSNIESESENMHGEIDNSSEQKLGKIVVQLILNDKTLFDVHEEDVTHWQELYPAVNVIQELRAMVAWCEANPQKRKTRKGINRFIVNWLAKKQDKGGGYSNVGNSFVPSRT